MKPIAAGAALLVLTACSSAPNDPIKPPPEIEIVQLYGPADVDYSRGMNSLDAQYAIQVTNPSTDPIRLKHVTLQSVGNSTILVRREDRAFDNEIPPGTAGQVVVNARVYFRSDSSGTPSREPMTLRLTLHFESSKGSFNRIVQKMIGQFPGQ